MLLGEASLTGRLCTALAPTLMLYKTQMDFSFIVHVIQPDCVLQSGLRKKGLTVRSSARSGDRR